MGLILLTVLLSKQCASVVNPMVTAMFKENYCYPNELWIRICRIRAVRWLTELHSVGAIDFEYGQR